MAWPLLSSPPKHHETTLEVAGLQKQVPFAFLLGFLEATFPASLCNQRAENWFRLLRMEIYGWTPRVGTRSSDCWFFKKNVKSCCSQQNCSVFPAHFEPLCSVCCLYVVPQHVVRLQPVSTTAGVPLEEGEKRDLCTVKRGTREMLIILSVPGNYVESVPFWKALL